MIGLFVGIESYSYSENDFNTLVQFCKQYGVDQIVLKIYEITQGEWYSGLEGGASGVIQRILAAGIDVLPYGYYYGLDAQTEIAATLRYLTRFGKYCMNLEEAFNNNDRIDPFVTGLANHDGDLYVSTWADPITQSYTANIAKLDTLVKVWMPECYTDTLVREMYEQFPHVLGMIWPTFHVLNTPFQDASIYPNCTLWEFQLAKTDTFSLQNYVLQNKGESVSTYPTNARGMICNPLQISEFQPGRSEFECGAFSVSILGRSTNYNENNGYSWQNGVAWAEKEYAIYAGSNSPSNSAGASIDDMHNMLLDTQKPNAGIELLHFWDTDISASTQQDHDIATIKAALQHGYPVIATVSEASVYDIGLGKNPYWWGPSGNHIFVYVGIATDGNLLVCDPANVIQGDGNLQTPKTLQTWPRKYDITRLDNQWATIIRTPWLPTVPSGDPLSWPPYTSPVTTPPPPTPAPDVAVSVIYDPNAKQLIFMQQNTAIYRIQVS